MRSVFSHGTFSQNCLNCLERSGMLTGLSPLLLFCSVNILNVGCRFYFLQVDNKREVRLMHNLTKRGFETTCDVCVYSLVRKQDLYGDL